MDWRQNMSQLCLKRLSYGHWHLNEIFQFVFWLQRRIPLESTIKRSFRSSESQSWLCLIIACLAIFRKKYVIFQFWTGKAIKQQSASDNLQKSRSGVQTPLCAPCLEPLTLHIFHITRVVHIWMTFSLKTIMLAMMLLQSVVAATTMYSVLLFSSGSINQRAENTKETEQTVERSRF